MQDKYIYSTFKTSHLLDFLQKQIKFELRKKLTKNDNFIIESFVNKYFTNRSIYHIVNKQEMTTDMRLIVIDIRYLLLEIFYMIPIF